MNEVDSISMLSVLANTLHRKVGNIWTTTMPRVVSDQRSKFENDELFRKLSRESEVKYTGYRDKPPEERQLRFQTECREGHADIAFCATGYNLQLSFTSNAWSDKPEDRVPTKDFVDFDRDPGKVHLKSQFIMNGVCVVWRGWLDLTRLDGVACLDFDADRAAVEDSLLREQIEQYNRRLQELEDRQRQYRDEQERRAEAEAERLLKQEKSFPTTECCSTQQTRGHKVRVADSLRPIPKADIGVRIPVPVRPVPVTNAAPLPWRPHMYIM
ncbi:hypothetical protein ScPMuIL_001304 [Solemya velum]